jgi:hypothetical protein
MPEKIKYFLYANVVIAFWTLVGWLLWYFEIQPFRGWIDWAATFIQDNAGTLIDKVTH